MRQALHIPYDLQPLIFPCLSLLTLYVLYVTSFTNGSCITASISAAGKVARGPCTGTSQLSHGSWETPQHLGSQNNTKLFIWGKMTVLFYFFLSLLKKLISSRKKPQTTCFGENEWEELSLESVMFFFLTGPIYHRSLRQPASNILEACVPSPAQEICYTQLKGKENICEHSSFPCWQWGGVSPSSFRPGGSQPLFFLLLP